MAIDLDLLTGYLDEEDLRYAVERDGKAVYVPFGGCTVRIFIIEDGEGLTFQAPQVFNLADCPRREAALTWMAEHVYGTKIGHFGYDSQDGEVDVSHFCPVEDGTVTKEQFLRMLYVVRQVATDDVKELRRAAFGTVDGDGDDDDLDDDAGGDLDRLLDDPFAEDDDNEPDEEPFEEYGPLPDAPVSEEVWVTTACDALARLARDVHMQRPMSHLREVIWPGLLALRQASAAAGEAYLAPGVFETLTIQGDLERLIWFMVARQRDGDLRITSHEVMAVMGRRADGPTQALQRAGVLVACDHDGVAPFMLGHTVLDPLAAVLPFEHTPLPPVVEPSNWPAAPIAEPVWLKLAYSAIHAHACDLDNRSRLRALREVLWPTLRALRSASVAAGEAYLTADLAGSQGLTEDAELLLAYCAYQASAGARRVTEVAMAQLVAKGHDDLIDALVGSGLLVSCDDDDQEPYTVGGAAEAAFGL